MRRIFKNDGSTTILVVVFMIVLIIFGLTIMTTSVSNMKLAEKKRDWLSHYYSMESNVAHDLAKLDADIGQIKDGFASNGDIAFEVAYSEELMRGLDEKGYEVYRFDDEVIVYMEFNDVSYEISKYITVELQLVIPKSKNELMVSDGFSVLSHTQWQDQFEYQDGVRFGDPFDFEGDPSINE